MRYTADNGFDFTEEEWQQHEAREQLEDKAVPEELHRRIIEKLKEKNNG